MTSALMEIRRPTPESLAATCKIALEEDNVHVIRATDILQRDGQIVGYLSIANIPCVHMWFRKKKAVMHDYLTAMAHFEGVLAKNQVQDFWLPCESTSPLLKFIPEAGYVKSNFDNMFIKQLK